MIKQLSASGKKRTARFDSLEQEVFLSLWRTYDRLRVFEEELFDAHDLTAQQYNVLRLLDHAFPNSIPTLDLATRLVSRAPDITRMIDKLEQRGLVSRVRQATDRRIVEIGITPIGRELVELLKQPVRECHQQQLGHLSRTDLKALEALLRAARESHESPDSSWR